VQIFAIPIRNEQTGEIRVVEIMCGFHVQAQVEALHHLFKQEGWRKATALQAEVAARVA